MFGKKNKTTVVRQPKISLCIDGEEYAFRTEWPLDMNFDIETFIDGVFLLGAGRERVLNFLIQSIGEFGQDNECMSDAQFLISEIQDRYKVMQQVKEEAGKKEPMVKPSDVHKHHFIAN